MTKNKIIMPNIINQSNNHVNSKTPQIVFLGTPEFAVPILEKLVQSEYKPFAVFCAQDKPIGRKQILTPPPVKISAQKYNIPVYQPKDALSIKHDVSGLKPDLIISVAYGMILPKEILEAPKFGYLNIHPSLLPKYRGASPIQAAILNGDQETGVTIIKMDEKIDHGPIVANSQFPMTNDQYTTPELSEKLAQLGANLLLEILPDWLAGKIKPQAQDEAKATYTKIIKKEDGLIDWKKSAAQIERQIRAYQPWPGAYTKLKVKSKKLKVIEAKILEKNVDKRIGEVFLTENNKLTVQTGQNALIIKKLQIEGGRPMDAKDFLRGHKYIIGQQLL